MNFEKLDTHLKNFCRAHPDLPGYDIIVQQKHRILFRGQYGWSDMQNRTPIRGDELYCMYSCSKPMTSTGVMRLVQDEALDLDTPAAHYLPCFADAYLLHDGIIKPPCHPITIRHLLTMTAGFTYNLKTEPLNALFQKEQDGSPQRT